jgi:enoyl-CoA hydratase/carnithine racemase
MHESSAGEAPGLLTERVGSVLWLTLNRPARRNAFDRATRVLFADALALADRDEAVRVVVLTGAGGSFCAGTDLKELPLPDPPHPLADRTEPIAAPVERMTKPVIAAVNGPAAGGGLEIALAADLRICSTAATFALPEVRVGSLPGSGGTQRLLASIPLAVAWKMLLTADPIDAPEALRVGLVSDVFEPAELRRAAQSLAERIAQNAPLSVRAAKLAGRAATEQRLASGLAVERLLWALLATSEDRAEGRAAFRERRKPDYKGR